MRFVGRILGFIIGAVVVVAPTVAALAWMFQIEAIEVTSHSRFGAFLIGAGIAGAAIADRIRMRLLRRMARARREKPTHQTCVSPITTPPSSRR
jgi:hypothetical protein